MSGKNKKIMKAVLVTIVILIFTLVLANKYNEFIDEKNDIKNRIGSEYTGGDMGVYEYKLLIEKTIGPYLTEVKNENYEKAYTYHTPEYNQYVSYDEYVEKMKDIDYTSYTVLNALQLTQNMYEVILRMADGDEQEFLIILNDKIANIVPENFLLYVETNETINRREVEYVLKGYKVTLNKCIFYVSIENKSNTNVEITSAKMYSTTNNIKSAENGEFIISPKSKLDLELTFDTSIMFPSKFEIERTDSNSVRTYEFRL